MNKIGFSNDDIPAGEPEPKKNPEPKKEGVPGDTGNPMNSFLGNLFGGMGPPEKPDFVGRVLQNDQRLMKIVEYDVTKGYTEPMTEPETAYKAFKEYKTLIRRGEFTMVELEERVFKQYGITE